METSTDYTYVDILNDERYKKLERHLKKIVMRNSEITDNSKTSNNVDYDMCLSSIHGDQIDTSYAGSHKLGSEVIASSNNIKNLQQRKINNNYSTLLGKTNKIESNECELMPPPKSIDILAHSSRKNSPVNSKNIIKTNIISPKKNILLQNDDKNKIKNKHHNKTINNNEPDRIFTKWKVTLNDNGQIVIKGTLECGKVAKSKPVIQRITSNTVKSIFKNIYLLKGIIYDEKNELPDYIRGKFYNGFPDDWENVHQLWKNYISSRHLNRTFRWPTPVSDTDDDITSEITDITNYKSSIFNQNNDDKNLTIIESIDESSKSIKQISDLQNKSINHDKCCCCCSTKSMSIRESTSSTIKTNKNNDNNNTINNFMKTLKQTDQTNQQNSFKKNKTNLTDIIREDGLTKILDNLSRENYSIEYIDKIIQMFDALKFFISHQQNEDVKNEFKNNQNIDQDKIKENIVNSSFNNNDNNKSYCSNKETINKKNNYYESSDSAKESSSDDDHNNKQLNKLLQNRKLSKRTRYSIRKNIQNNSINDEHKLNPLSICDNKKQIVEQKSLTKESSFTDNNYKGFDKLSKTQENKSSRCIDSDISITEDERKSQYDYYNDQDKRFINKQKSLSVNMINYQSSKQHNSNACEIKNINSNSSFIEQEFERIHQNNIDEINSNELNNIKTKQTNEYQNKNITKNNNSSNTMISQQKLVNKSPTVLDNDKENNLIYQKKNTEEKKNIKKPIIVDIQDKPMNLKILTSQKLPVNKNDKIILNKQINKSPIKLINENKNNTNLMNDELNLFGTQSNPKKLSNWIPKLKKKNNGDYGLIFEGKLLNEVNHIINRKFTTELLYKRINRILIETIDNNFYELVGELNNTKHQIPKSIQKYFLRGCPRVITRVCEKWVTEQQLIDNVNIDIDKQPKSSSGRIIYPQLSYWQGQKLSVIDNKLIYSPGHSQESSFDNSKKNNSQNSTKSRDTSSKDSSFTGQGKHDNKIKKNITEINKKNSNNVDTNIELNEPRRVTRLMKRRRVYDTRINNIDTSEDDETIDRKKKKITTKQLEKKSIEQKKKDDINKQINKPIISNQSKNLNNIKITYSYKKNVPFNNDLSDDEISIIN